MKSPTQTCEEHENHKEMPFIQGMSQRSMTYSYKVQNVLPSWVPPILTMFPKPMNNKKEALSFERTSLKVVPDGLEPPLTEPKTVVLPLHHGTINGCKGTCFRGCHQILTQLFYA